MKIEKAIEILDRHYNLHLNVTREEMDKASQLGIEALQAVRQLREWNVVFGTHKLPGETEE